ncbi:MAG: 50S ribosomal protein L21 [bacterium]|nr:50S ribosomal protein L21 [bacterium]
MFVIADIAGFQEKLEEGLKLFVPTLKGEEGKIITFDKVYLVANSDSDVKVGTPTVAGASVESKILNHGKGDKIRVFKMKRRKRYRRTYGHRQGYTEIEIMKITVGGGAAKNAPAKAAEEK